MMRVLPGPYQSERHGKGDANQPECHQLFRVNPWRNKVCPLIIKIMDSIRRLVIDEIV